MANQNAIVRLTGGRDLRIVVVDTAGSAATFTDIGAASTFIADRAYRILDIVGVGTTAPATAVNLQPNVNGNDKSKFANLAAMYDPKSDAKLRAGALLGALIPAGTSLRLISR